MTDKQKNILKGIVIVIIVVAIGFFMFNHKTIAPNKEVNTTENTENTSGDKPMDTGVKGDTTKNTPAPYSFVPYTNAKLITEAKVTLSGDQKKFVENRLANNQKTVAGFTNTTALDVRVNTLFLVFADQQLLGHYADAKKTLEQALALGRNENLLQVYASLLVTMGDANGALKYINDAIAINPKIPNFWRTKIDIMRQLHANDLASLDAVFLDAIQKTENDIDMLTLYATYLTEMGKYSTAIIYWEKAIVSNPDGKDGYQKEIDALKNK